MYSRSRTWGSGARAPVPQPAPAPSAGPQRPRPGLEQGPEAGQVHAPQALTSAYTLIKPNENRRNQIQRIAEQELENLEKWKEQHRAKPINLVPQQLGGSQSEAEVRQRQQFQLMQSKYQQKLKREESIRIKKEAEEAEIQKMKAIQREKGNRLEEKKRLHEKLRREEFRVHQQYVTADMLNEPNTDSPSKNAHQVAPCEPASSSWKLPALSSDHSQSRNWSYRDSLKEEENRRLQKMKEEQRQKSELLKFKQEQQEEQRIRTHQSEQRRVNNAFLDRLQGKSQPGGLERFGGYWNMNSRNSWGS